MEDFQMRYFCEVYRRMSISDAARQLHTAQSTITIAGFSTLAFFRKFKESRI